MSVTRINEFQAATGQADALFDFLKSLKQSTMTYLIFLWA